MSSCYATTSSLFFKGHASKGNVMDEFADNIVNCICKEVVYYTNLAQGSTSTGEKGKSVEFSADA
jgi:hypothetical protein